MSLLKVENLGIKFGGLLALKETSFCVEEGEIVSVIGPNGAGKTTLFNIVTGIYEPSFGSLKINSCSPKKNLNLKHLLYFLFCGFLTAALLFTVINIEALWESLITSNYIYQQAFQWENLNSSFDNFISSLSWNAKYGVFILGVVLGSTSSYVIWNRSRCTPEIIKKHGLARTFQNIRIFSKMTVIDNLRVANNSKRECEEILKFVGLDKESDLLADKLSYGHQRRLEIARALATKPHLILLDEPAAGMNPSEAHDLMNLIREIKEKGISVLLIEHHMKVVMGISDRIVVLNYGEKIAEGSPEEVRNNQEVIKAYLGGS